MEILRVERKGAVIPLKIYTLGYILSEYEPKLGSTPMKLENLIAYLNRLKIVDKKGKPKEKSIRQKLFTNTGHLTFKGLSLVLTSLYLDGFSFTKPPIKHLKNISKKGPNLKKILNSKFTSKFCY